MPNVSATAAPRLMSPGACDCHVHVFDPDRFAYIPERSYTPGRASAGALRALLDGLGLERVVLIQPSVHGSDNRGLLQAMADVGPERARGVAVIDPRTASAEALDDLRAAGVRGLRLNLESGHDRRAEALAEALGSVAPLAAKAGFFVQIYTGLTTIESVADILRTLPVPVVLDHYAGAKARGGSSQPGFAALLELLAGGNTWVKLSAPYRASDEPAYDDLREVAEALITHRPDRMVWGSDWPHTGGGAARLAIPFGEVEPFRTIDNEVVLDRLAQWAGDPKVFRRILSDNPAELFGF